MLLLLLLSRFSRVQLCDFKDGSPPGSSVPGILQARTLAWVAISFSSAWKWKVKVKWASRVGLLATPWTAAHQAPPSMGFSRREYWSGVPLPSPITLVTLCLIYHRLLDCGVLVEKDLVLLTPSFAVPNTEPGTWEMNMWAWMWVPREGGIDRDLWLRVTVTGYHCVCSCQEGTLRITTLQVWVEKNISKEMEGGVLRQVWRKSGRTLLRKLRKGMVNSFRYLENSNQICTDELMS